MSIKLAYSTFGLTRLPFADAIDAVACAGYDGVEIAFHRDQFNPFNLTDSDLDAVRQRLDKAGVAPACVATASHFFNPLQPHEPSLMALEVAGRRRRIDLIKRGIRVARHLGCNLVTFGSGFVREEHVRNPSIDPGKLLVASIRECLRAIQDNDDITLLIEPEPGMYIETLDDALALIKAVGSPRLRLHVDICHAFCSDVDLHGALRRAAPATRYLHVSDAREGYNLRIVVDSDDVTFDLNRASTLVYFPDTADFLLVDRRLPLYFRERAPGPARQQRIETLLAFAGVEQPWEQVDYGNLHCGATRHDDEIFTWLLSIPGLSFDALERARPIVACLRGIGGPMLVDRMVANTRTGVAHFHEIPGAGTQDIAAAFQTLTDSGFDGFGSVELYHHVDSWQQALDESFRHLHAINSRLVSAA